jgi:predicted transcriptional regulator
LWGFLNGNFFLILVAFFIFMGAGQEGQMVQIRSVFDGVRVDQAFSRKVVSLSPDSSLRDAVNITLNSFQSDFPICDGDSLVGLLTHARLIEALNNLPPETTVSNVMVRDIPSVDPQAELYRVQQRMSEENYDALPVVEDGKFLGLITSRDISELFRLLSRQPEILAAKRPV